MLGYLACSKNDGKKTNLVCSHTRSEAILICIIGLYQLSNGQKMG